MIEETVLVTEIFADLDHDALAHWRAQGWLRPICDESAVYYEEVDLARIRLIRDLREAMAVNEAGVAVALNLLDQLHDVRDDMTALLRAIARQDAAVRQAIAQAVAEELPATGGGDRPDG